MGGKPCVRGMRVTVARLLVWLLQVTPSARFWLPIHISRKRISGKSKCMQLGTLVAGHHPGNIAITQLVDKPVVGAHVKMPKCLFR